jgi:hypothetical protein
MSTKKGKVAQVVPTTDPPEGECICSLFCSLFTRSVCVYLFGSFYRFLTQVCCDQTTTTKTPRLLS